MRRERNRLLRVRVEELAKVPVEIRPRVREGEHPRRVLYLARRREVHGPDTQLPLARRVVRRGTDSPNVQKCKAALDEGYPDFRRGLLTRVCLDALQFLGHRDPRAEATHKRRRVRASVREIHADLSLRNTLGPLLRPPLLRGAHPIGRDNLERVVLQTDREIAMLELRAERLRHCVERLRVRALGVGGVLGQNLRDERARVRAPHLAVDLDWTGAVYLAIVFADPDEPPELAGARLVRMRRVKPRRKRGDDPQPFDRRWRVAAEHDAQPLVRERRAQPPRDVLDLRARELSDFIEGVKIVRAALTRVLVAFGLHARELDRAPNAARDDAPHVIRAVVVAAR